MYVRTHQMNSLWLKHFPYPVTHPLFRRIFVNTITPMTSAFIYTCCDKYIVKLSKINPALRLIVFVFTRICKTTTIPSSLSSILVWAEIIYNVFLIFL